MKHSVLFAALGLAAFGAAAQEVGNVISSVPVIQQVAVPRTTCAPTMVEAQPMTSGGGGLLGAIAGGVIGSTIGGGSGTGAAIVAGTALGAIVGNNIEASNARAQQVATPNCVTETSYENRTVAYNVTYEYAGRQYTVQMPYDPGSTLRLQVTPLTQAPPPVTGGAVTAPPVLMQATPAPAIATAPVLVPAPIVVQPYPVYPAAPYPYYRPFYPPVNFSLGFVFGGHRHGHHHGHRHHGQRPHWR